MKQDAILSWESREGPWQEDREIFRNVSSGDSLTVTRDGGTTNPLRAKINGFVVEYGVRYRLNDLGRPVRHRPRKKVVD